MRKFLGLAVLVALASPLLGCSMAGAGLEGAKRVTCHIGDVVCKGTRILCGEPDPIVTDPKAAAAPMLHEAAPVPAPVPGPEPVTMAEPDGAALPSRDVVAFSTVDHDVEAFDPMGGNGRGKVAGRAGRGSCRGGTCRVP